MYACNRRFQRIARALAPAVLIVALATAAGAQPPAWPPKIENLKVLPEDTPANEVIGIMRGFALGLDVRCWYCHVGEEGKPLHTFDFASDEKETKRKARVMLQMVRAINGEHLPKLGDARDPAIEVSCATCHGGIAKPEPLDAILVRKARQDGADAALDRYRALRQDHYGGRAYDFGEQTLVMAAETLGGGEAPEKDLAAAAALLELNLEHHPDSTWTLGTLAGVQRKRGEIDAAIAAIEKLIALDPENERLKQQLEALKAAESEE